MDKFSDDLIVHVYAGQNIPVSGGKTIVEYICALLNSEGGRLVLSARNDTNIVENVHSFEQYFKGVIGSYNVHKCFEISELEDNRVTLVVSGLPRSCTLNTHLYLPSSTAISSLVPIEQRALREILFENRAVGNSEHDVPEQLCYGHKLEFGESKTVQFKNLKTDEGDFASRAIGDRFTAYVSGFANGWNDFVRDQG